MRLLGMLLALGAIGWVLYNASGNGESDTIIPESYQQSLDKAQGVEEMVKISDINLTSTCEHHFVTIDGIADVAYIPHEKIIGLSKINRIVRFFAQRPQVQERLTQQILVALQTLLETDSVAVRVKATHYCVKSRGVMDTSSQTETSALGGQFKANPTARAEFLR